MNTTKSALIWITSIITKHNIPYQIAGGLAVQAYGSTRKLMDIDIDIPEEAFEIVADEVADFITFGPANFKSDSWDLYLMTLNYHGQEIDICGAYSSKIYDKTNERWVKLNTDFARVNTLEIYGLNLSVIRLEELIAYKKILSRPVDLIDIDYLENAHPK